MRIQCNTLANGKSRSRKLVNIRFNQHNHLYNTTYNNIRIHSFQIHRKHSQRMITFRDLKQVIIHLIRLKTKNYSLLSNGIELEINSQMAS